MSADTDNGVPPASSLPRPLARSVLWRRVKRAIVDALRPTRRALRSVTYRGAQFVVFTNEDVGWRIVTKRGYEGAELDALERLVRPDDLCVDVGANIGIYSVLLSRMARDGAVISFEPVSLNQQVLRLNLALNEAANVEVRPMVLSDSVGHTDFAVSSDGAFSSLKSSTRKPHLSDIRCRMSTLDHEFPDRRVDFVKLDVEGAELLVLKGGSGLLSTPGRKPRAILVEIAETNMRAYGYTASELLACLRALGYELHTIRGSQLVHDGPLKAASENVLFLDASRLPETGRR
jgi:FkbM family methyltransferase